MWGKELTEAQKKALEDYEKERQERIERIRQKWDGVKLWKKSKAKKK